MLAPASWTYSCRCTVGAARTVTRMNIRARSNREVSVHTAAASPVEQMDSESQVHVGKGWRGEGVSLKEWQGWGTSSPVPAMVTKVIEDLKLLERETEGGIKFGGIGGKLQGDFKTYEDRKQRKAYKSLDSEMKFQFYAARQIACRLLGSRGYLCQKCWLAMEDCMCFRLAPCSLWSGIRFWLYMHPKDFLRQNNTGKLLWQIFGVQSASLCLYGIHEQEEIMWNAFKLVGREYVWILYPNRNSKTMSVRDISLPRFMDASKDHSSQEGGPKSLNFVLIDGTWNNSVAMYSRLKEQAKGIWGEEELPCLSLSDLGVSPMHKLRPQPGWDRTCTAAAALGLLSELHLHPELGSCGLDEPARALEHGLDVLLDSLTSRRVRKGRSVNRRERHPLF